MVALSWHRPSMDFLSLRSRPASLGSRIYFSFVLCFELFVSELSSFSCKLPIKINLSQGSISSFFTLRLHRAPAVRLIDSSISRSNTPITSTSSQPSRSPPPSHPAAATTTTTTTTTNTRHSLDPPELLDSLSLSSAPIPLRTRHAKGPVFGHPSLRPATFNPPSPRASSAPAPTRTPLPLPLPQSQSQSHLRDGEDEDAMDWTPTTSPAAARPQPASRGLFHADESTGLETLLERTNILDLSEPGGMSSRTRRGGSSKSPQTWSWGWVYALSLVPLVAMMYYQLL